MGDHENIKAFMSDLRADREELRELRRFHDEVRSILSATRPVNPGRLEYLVHDPMKVVTKITDALPKREAYHALRSADRVIKLSGH